MKKYILIFLLTVTILFSLLILVSKIPKSAIENNLKESANFYTNKEGLEGLFKKPDYEIIHYYADSMLLNIIYHIDENHPVKSVMWANYYETIKMDANDDFINSVCQETPANQEYMRYWHGSMVIIRPILMIFNIEQIYLINKIIMWILAILLLILLFIKNKKLAVIYIIAMTMIVFPIVPCCLEYTWTFYLMFIVSIIAIFIEKKGDSHLFNLFFVTGILTCYFDFLSTEIITFLVPVLIVLSIRKKEDRLSSFKEGFLFVLKSCLLWGIAYVLMWFSKWILAGIILNINPIDYVKDNAMLRINGLQGLSSPKEMYMKVLPRNLKLLFPFFNLYTKKYFWQILGLSIFVILAFFDWKNIKKKWFSLLMLIIGIMPYVRYLILANHSFRHAFFTYRSQIISIIALALIIENCLNYNLLFKEIKIGKKK